jgi:pentatricopeptide repeat protein
VRCSAWNTVEDLIVEMDCLKVPLLESVMISLINACKRVRTIDRPSWHERSLSGREEHSPIQFIHWEKAIWLLETFCNRTNKLSDSIFTICMDVCQLAGKYDEVINIHKLMLMKNVTPSKSSFSFTFTTSSPLFL